MKTRELSRVITAVEASDGAGVRLRRSLGQRPDARLDPFLLLDEFASDDPDDYIAGFPAHPHRGFETVTYMLEGRLLHEDHLGNQGQLSGGGAQWMTAGRGIIHSEMPQQTQGRMHGFQLWINLPARQKLCPAGYRDVRPEEIAVAELGGGASARVLAGDLSARAAGSAGATERAPVTGPVTGVATEPLFADLRLPAGTTLNVPVPTTHNVLIYVYAGRVSSGAERRSETLTAHQAGLLGPGDQVALTTGSEPARLLLLAARPLGEPVVQYGPFVMNSREEIEQALADYRDGRLTG